MHVCDTLLTHSPTSNCNIYFSLVQTKHVGLHRKWMEQETHFHKLFLAFKPDLEGFRGLSLLVFPMRLACRSWKMFYDLWSQKKTSARVTLYNMRELHRAVIFLQRRMVWFMCRWIRLKMENGGTASETE